MELLGSRIRQIEAKALNHLRISHIDDCIKDYVGDITTTHPANNRYLAKIGIEDKAKRVLQAQEEYKKAVSKLKEWVITAKKWYSDVSVYDKIPAECFTKSANNITRKLFYSGPSIFSIEALKIEDLEEQKNSGNAADLDEFLNEIKDAGIKIDSYKNHRSETIEKLKAKDEYVTWGELCCMCKKLGVSEQARHMLKIIGNDYFTDIYMFEDLEAKIDSILNNRFFDKTVYDKKVIFNEIKELLNEMKDAGIKFPIRTKEEYIRNLKEDAKNGIKIEDRSAKILTHVDELKYKGGFETQYIKTFGDLKKYPYEILSKLINNKKQLENIIDFMQQIDLPIKSIEEHKSEKIKSGKNVYIPNIPAVMLISDTLIAKGIMDEDYSIIDQVSYSDDFRNSISIEDLQRDNVDKNDISYVSDILSLKTDKEILDDLKKQIYWSSYEQKKPESLHGRYTPIICLGLSKDIRDILKDRHIDCISDLFYCTKFKTFGKEERTIKYITKEYLKSNIGLNEEQIEQIESKLTSFDLSLFSYQDVLNNIRDNVENGRINEKILDLKKNEDEQFSLTNLELPNDVMRWLYENEITTVEKLAYISLNKEKDMGKPLNRDRLIVKMNEALEEEQIKQLSDTIEQIGFPRIPTYEERKKELEDKIVNVRMLEKKEVLEVLKEYEQLLKISDKTK